MPFLLGYFCFTRDARRTGRHTQLALKLKSEFVGKQRRSDWPPSRPRQTLHTEAPEYPPTSWYTPVTNTAAKRRKNYSALFEACLGSQVIDSIRKATNGNSVLGDSRFQQEVEQVLARRVTPGKPGRPLASLK